MHKKSVVLFSLSLVILRSSTTYSSQLQRVKPTPKGGASLLYSGMNELKVSKFQGNQCKLLHFFRYSYNARNELRFYIIGKIFNYTIFITANINFFLIQNKKPTHLFIDTPVFIIRITHALSLRVFYFPSLSFL